MGPNSNLQSGANPNKDIAVESKAINMDRKYIFYNSTQNVAMNPLFHLIFAMTFKPFEVDDRYKHKPVYVQLGNVRLECIYSKLE